MEGKSFGANMLMFSRQGFIDLAKKKYLRDPDAGLGRVVAENGIGVGRSSEECTA